MMSKKCLPDEGSAQALEPGSAGVGTASPARLETWLHGGSALLDGENRILSLNETLATWLETPAEQLRGQSLPQLLGQRHAGWEQALKRFLAEGQEFDRLELAAEESGRGEKLSAECCRTGSGCVLRLESVLPSVEELERFFSEQTWARVVSQRIYQRMVRSETQVDNLLNRWPGIVFSQRPDYSFAFVSAKIEELTGVPAGEWRRRSTSFWEVVHEADAEALAARLRTEAHSPSGMTSTFRIRHVRTGRVTYLWEHRQAVRSSNGLLLGFEGIWLDITRQTIAERRLLNMSWRENLGTLTMGLAHDFCNIMTGIVGLSETFEANVKEDESLKSGLSLIRSTALQASELAHRIRQLHQGLPGEKSYQDLNESLSSLVEVLQKVLPRRLRVKMALESGQLPIYVDNVELQQVVVNLALNAADAMPKSGELTFRTARHEHLPAVEHMQGSMPRSRQVIRLSVQDTGSGIPERFLASIFDPFFTTKPLGKGSGLGLYNARLFAEKHGAAISVETKEGAGTTFNLWFPQADFTEGQSGENEPRSERPTRHTLLVVGPEEQVLSPLVEMLRQNGYYVVPASNEADAVEALHAPHFQFTGLIVLCTSGRAAELSLCQRIRSYKLPLKTMLSLFGCNQDEVEECVLQTVDAVVPFDLPAQDFLARLKRVLEQP